MHFEFQCLGTKILVNKMEQDIILYIFLMQLSPVDDNLVSVDRKDFLSDEFNVCRLCFDLIRNVPIYSFPCSQFNNSHVGVLFNNKKHKNQI